MMNIGQVCIKIAGRDAGMKGAIVDVLEGSFVMVDGQVRRKKCNIKHLEPLAMRIEIGKNAPHEEVVKELKKLGIEVSEKKTKEKKEKPVKAKPAAKKPAKKIAPKKPVKKKTSSK